MAQLPLSRRIRDLEEELRLRLLDRTKRRVALTRPGRVFLTEARALLGQVERAVQRARRVDSGEVGELSIGTVAAADFTSLPRIVRVFHERHPDIFVDLKDLTTPEQVAALREHRIDIGFLRTPIKLPWLTVERLLSEDIIVALPQGHRLTMHQRIPVAFIANEPCVFLRRSRAPTLSDLVLSVYRDAGLTPAMSYEADYPDGLLGYVAAGLGISLVPASFQSVPRPGVVYRPLKPAPPKMAMLLAWRRNDLSPVGQAFLDIAREAVKT
jgi:DNA-binding transcriptional LysR family regulator